MTNDDLIDRISLLEAEIEHHCQRRTNGADLPETRGHLGNVGLNLSGANGPGAEIKNP